MSPQQRLHQQAETAPPASVRLDADMQRKVIALATRLQNEHRETVTADQLEAAAAEAGLDRSFVRQAIAQVVAAGSSPVATAAPRQAGRGACLQQEVSGPARKRCSSGFSNHAK